MSTDTINGARTEAISTIPTTLLPIEGQPPRRYRISVTDLAGTEVQAKPDLELEQEVLLAVRAKVTGVTIHDGYKADVMTFRTEVLSIDTVDDVPTTTPALPAPAAPQQHTSRFQPWMYGGIGGLFGAVLTTLWPLLG